MGFTKAKSERIYHDRIDNLSKTKKSASLNPSRIIFNNSEKKVQNTEAHIH